MGFAEKEEEDHRVEVPELHGDGGGGVMFTVDEKRVKERKEMVGDEVGFVGKR